ncbi:MAG: MerR family transcriptional regulator [bacterium]|nr:MerR family transcriptional regulator [bacterium]
MYTVKQAAALANISVRTLHYYDEIGLLPPTRIAANSYRWYDDAALFRLQQILLYREMGFDLQHIKTILDEPGFDALAALRAHRAALQARLDRAYDLIRTVENTILHLEEGTPMSKPQLFKALSAEQSKDFERRARLEYGPDIVNASVRRWNSYSDAERQAIIDEGNQVYADLVTALEAGKTAADADVQAIFKRWHAHIQYFYEPTLEILGGLGELYRTNPEFIANFVRLHPGLPDFLHAGIVQYVDDLETAEIERLIAADAAQDRLQAD